MVRILVGNAKMSWENLIRLVRDVPAPQASGFAKNVVLPGNARQRISILSHMIAQQKEGKPHTDVSQLLVLAKSSQATEDRDKIYAFYGMTFVSTTPDYLRSTESLYVDIAHNYINNIEACYDDWKDLSETSRTFQLMSMLYSAGALHQNYSLPSFVPDWSCSWELAPIWCQTGGSNATSLATADGRESIRSVYRAGGAERDHFQVIETSSASIQLQLSALIIDTIAVLGETDEAMERIMHSDHFQDAIEAEELEKTEIATSMQYMRIFYLTTRGLVGVATQGIQTGDVLAVFLGGDVPVILRPTEAQTDTQLRLYTLQCETIVASDYVMSGDYVRSRWTRADDILLI